MDLLQGFADWLLELPIYIEPPNLVPPTDMEEQEVLKLQRSFHGLKEEAKIRYETIAEIFKSCGLTEIKSAYAYF